MRRGIVLSLILLIIALAGCLPVSDLPSTPGKPGQRSHAGSAGYATSYEGYAEAADYWFDSQSPFTLPTEAFTLTPDISSITLELIVDPRSVGGVSYSKGYYWDGTVWKEFELDGEKIGGTDWLRGGGIANLNIPIENLPSGENYIVTYPCERVGTEWKCGCQGATGPCGFWMLQTFNIHKCDPISMPLCLDGYTINNPPDDAHGCPQSRTCVPIDCPAVPIPVCDVGYTLKTTMDASNCPQYECVLDLPSEPCPPIPECEEGGPEAVSTDINSCAVYKCCPTGATAPCTEEQTNQSYSNINTAPSGECSRYRCCGPVFEPLCLEGYAYYNPGPDANGCPQSGQCLQVETPCPMPSCIAPEPCAADETLVSVPSYNADGCPMCADEKCVKTLAGLITVGNSPYAGAAKDTWLRKEADFNVFMPGHLVNCGDSCGSINYNIDWKFQSVIASNMGQKSTGGYSIALTDLKDKTSVVAVLVKETTPSDGAVTQMITSPAASAKIPRFSKPIAFVHTTGTVNVFTYDSDDNANAVPNNESPGEELAKTACEAFSGSWQQSQMGNYFCNLPAPDAGNPCSDGKDCSAGICQAAGDHGECYAWMHMNGCVSVWTGSPNTQSIMCT